VWATTWQDEANPLISPAVGLPPLPIITVGSFAQGLPLAWLDRDSA
jgi:hypothetical protein